MSKVDEVLFVCIHNAGRSQMAAALLARHGGDRVVVRSAGTAPAETINPAVVEVMAEIGIDLHANGAHPKRLDEAAVQASDVVITMGCGDECPFYPGKRYLDWALPDPAGQGVDAVRPIRDEIDRRVRQLLAELDNPPAPADDGRQLRSVHVDSLPLEQQHLVRRAAANLEREFAGTFGRETVERFIADSFEQLVPTAKVTNFLPLLTERFARERLRALAKVEGIGSSTPGVLFLCVHNAGRSQMAAAWLRHLGDDRVTVWSGGSEPVSTINPAVTEAMAEVGIDVSQEFPKPWTDEVVRAADVVVTMGCGDACPLYPGKRYEDWELADPAGRTVADVRPIRDEIRARVEALLASLDVPAGRA